MNILKQLHHFLKARRGWIHNGRFQEKHPKTRWKAQQTDLHEPLVTRMWINYILL